MMSQLSLIVAHDKNRGIGIENRLPWHLPEDLSHFKTTTSGHTLIMGRKTFESIGRVLPNRRHIIVTRNTEWQFPGVEVAHSLNQAQEMAACEQAFIIGGAEIYQQALDVVDTIIATEIDGEFNCDAFFPVLDLSIWRENTRISHTSASKPLSYAFVTYQKY